MALGTQLSCILEATSGERRHQLGGGMQGVWLVWKRIDSLCVSWGSLEAINVLTLLRKRRCLWASWDTSLIDPGPVITNSGLIALL